MNMEQTVRRLSDLQELAREVMAEEMTEVYLLPIKPEDVEAIRKAAVVLECFRIAGGVFDGGAEA